MKIVKSVRPPAGLNRFLYRLPIYAYRAHLGWVFGERILLLHHIGRVSGQPRQAVLEVADHDRANDSFVVASGWGPTAAWYQNVLHTPNVTIDVGRRTLPVTAVALDADEGADIFARYAMRHRVLAKLVLPRVMGFAVNGSEADFREAGRHMPFVRFVPHSPVASD
ncbi:nitroreductase family deazaflavin-dependent oxidoreductase [Mycolicibacterium llatzerense]|uniref:nitroreductase family deazaflavin-dependent oxidoreductase n=1 Tax=Mycolicibacterium llatzerense TaxID=280871 RepID=UPI0021B5E22C|nr:nitroreductase family deazaflavin-dependent oxidoreductase [Mycolicibacterium llatzerense]MCT7365015.1 nitroreductase [Mycolicibacterium llatzerense]